MRQLIFILLLLAWVSAQANAGIPDLKLQQNSGFCEGGGFMRSPRASWGTFCTEADQTTGRAVTEPFQVDQGLSIYVSGFPQGEGMSLRLENVSGHEFRDIRLPEASETWQRLDLAVPETWRGQQVRIVAEDRSTAGHGWLAFSKPFDLDKKGMWGDTKRILFKTPLFTLLIFLPGFALCAFAVGRGINGTVKLGMIVLAGVAIPGYLLFYVYLLSHTAGYRLAGILPFVWGGLLAIQLLLLNAEQRRRLLPLLIPLGLTFTAAVFSLSMGFEYGGLLNAIQKPWSRFADGLPPDNEMPWLFAEGLRQGVVPSPIMADWLSSDRPPLQAGMTLALMPVMKTQRELWYQVSSVVLQSLWVFALWLLLKALGCSRMGIMLVLVSTVLSGTVIVNSFYVWPKMLAAAYAIAFSIPIFAGGAMRLSGWMIRLLMAFLVVCALLAHGGSLFAVLGLLLYMALKFRFDRVAEATAIAALAVVLYMPWMAYQKFVDPPGDRLLKYHFAGVEPLTKEPALRTILNAYRKQSFGDWVAAKEGNIANVVGQEADYLQKMPHLLEAPSQHRIRDLEFFYLVPSIGFAVWGIAALGLKWFRKSASPDEVAAEKLLQSAFLMTIPWILLMFKGQSTTLHQGTYVLVLFGIAGCILALCNLSVWLAAAICVAQCGVNWIVYSCDLSGFVFPNALLPVRNNWMLGLELTGLCAFIALALAAASSTFNDNDYVNAPLNFEAAP